MKNYVFGLLFFVCFLGFPQAKNTDDIYFSVKKSKVVLNVSDFGLRQLKVKDDRLQKVMVKLEVSSLKDNRVKLSAFSLLDTVNKIRYRLADYMGYRGFVGSPEQIPYMKTELLNKKGKPVKFGAPYDAAVKDYFNDYDMDGYRNFEIPINFGSKEDPKHSIVYFGETKYKDFTADLFFAVIAENKRLTYELYYKNVKVEEVTFKE